MIRSNDQRSQSGGHHPVSQKNTGCSGSLNPSDVVSTSTTSASMDWTQVFVEGMWVELSPRFNAAGFRVHEVDTDKDSSDLLGVHLDLERHQTDSRKWELRLGPKAIATPDSCTGKSFDVIIGHCAFFVLVQRAALVTLHDVYSFISKSNHIRAKMWHPVRPELDLFCGLLLLFQSDWRGPFSCDAFLVSTQYQHTSAALVLVRDVGVQVVK